MANLVETEVCFKSLLIDCTASVKSINIKTVCDDDTVQQVNAFTNLLGKQDEILS